MGWGFLPSLHFTSTTGCCIIQLMTMFATSFFVGLLDHPFLFILTLLAILVGLAMACALIHMTYDFILRAFNRLPLNPFGGYFGSDDDGGDGGNNVPDDPVSPDNLVYTNTSNETLKDEDYVFNKTEESKLWSEQ